MSRKQKRGCIGTLFLLPFYMIYFGVVICGDMAQMSLFDTVTDEDVLKELMEVEVTTLTPLDALNTLYRLQNKLKNRWKD